MQTTLTPQQFATLLVKMQANSEAGLTKVSDTSGSITTNQISLHYLYAPASSTLQIAVLTKHGLARFASDKTIDDRISALIAANV